MLLSIWNIRNTKFCLKAALTNNVQLAGDQVKAWWTFWLKTLT